jgi:hypothetical protein
MSAGDPAKEKPVQTQQVKADKPGFFTRFLGKIDDRLKAKAMAVPESGSCCGGKKGKDGKCC